MSDPGDEEVGLAVVHLLVPVFDRHGRQYAEDLKNRVEEELERRFGGWSQLSARPLPGAWRNPATGQIERDCSLRYEVGVPASRLTELDELLSELATEIGQRAIWRVLFVGAEGRAISARTFDEE